MTDRATRPAGVTIVAVVAWISGALDIISGTILLFQSGVASVVSGFGGTGQLYGAAIGSIIVGLVIVAVAGGLLGGSSTARMIVTVVEVLSIIGSFFLAFAYLSGAIGEWIGIVVSIVVLLLLWTRRANSFFNS